MIDELAFHQKIEDLKSEKETLLKEREDVIATHSSDIEDKIDVETKKFIDENRDRIVYEVVGSELDEIDSKIKVNEEITSTLVNLIVTQEEIHDEVPVDTNLDEVTDLN